MLIRIKGISSGKAKSIVAKSRPSDQVVSEPIRRIISETAREMLHKMQMIERETDLVTKGFKDHADVKLLSTIKGIGTATAVRIMLEVESIERFESAKKLCSFFGLHPTFKQSGDGTWGSKLSKKGRPDLRAAFYMCSLSAIHSDANQRQLYARFRSLGMNHYQAICVVMHKMLRIIYGVLKNQTAYNPKIDNRNKEIAQQKREETEARARQQKQERKRKSEKYKGEETDTPISRIAAQKRKKQETSQASTVEACTGSNPALPKA